MQKNQKIHNHIFPNLNKYENLSKKYKSVTLKIPVTLLGFAIGDRCLQIE